MSRARASAERVWSPGLVVALVVLIPLALVVCAAISLVPWLMRQPILSVDAVAGEPVDFGAHRFEVVESWVVEPDDAGEASAELADDEAFVTARIEATWGDAADRACRVELAELDGDRSWDAESYPAEGPWTDDDAAISCFSDGEPLVLVEQFRVPRSALEDGFAIRVELSDELPRILRVRL